MNDEVAVKAIRTEMRNLIHIMVFKQLPGHKYYDPAQKDRWTIRTQVGWTVSNYHCVTWEYARDYLRANIGW